MKSKLLTILMTCLYAICLYTFANAEKDKEPKPKPKPTIFMGVRG